MSAGLNRKTKADTVGGSASISQKHTNIAGELLNYTNFLYVEMTGKTAHAERPAEIRASRYVDILSRIALETVRESCRASDMRITTMSIHVNKLNAAMKLCVEHDLCMNIRGQKSERTGEEKRIRGREHWKISRNFFQCSRRECSRREKQR